MNPEQIKYVDEAIAAGATTTKRSIESNVLIEDGGIVVLGGLIGDEFTQNEDRVPLLGDIPIIGNLFRNTNRTRKKTNMMVFLRPVVLRDAGSTLQFSQDRYEAIRATQQLVQPDANIMMRNVNGAAVLPSTQGAVVLPAVPPASIVNIPGSTPQLVDFTQPNRPTVNGLPAPAPVTTPSAAPGNL